MNYDLIKTLFIKVEYMEDKVVKQLLLFNKNIVIRDAIHASELIKKMEDLFVDFSIISRKGYVNDPKTNLPMVLYLVNEFGIIDEKDMKKFDASILMNTLYYNLILLAMLRLVIEIENKEFLSEDQVFNTLTDDQWIDLKNIRKNIMRMIHPNILNRIRSKGLTIVLNSITGFDSEYEIKSSVDMTNELLSVQLASNSNIYIKVPKNKPSFTQSSIKIEDDDVNV